MPRAARPESSDFAVARRIARLAGIDNELTCVHQLGEGVKGRVLRLDFEGRESLALKLYSAAGADRERAGFELAARHDLPLPRMMAGADGPDPAAALGWTLMTLAPGRGLNRVLAQMTLEQELDVHRQTGALLRRLHAAVCPRFGRGGTRPDFATNGEYVVARFESALARFTALGGDAGLAGRIRALLAARNGALAACRQPVFCHGDLHAENVRVRQAEHGLEVVGAIDLEEWFAGDPALDIALTWAARSPHDDDVYWALLDGYGDAPGWLDSVLDIYIVLAELKLWIYYAVGDSREPLVEIEERIEAAVGTRG